MARPSQHSLCFVCRDFTAVCSLLFLSDTVVVITSLLKIDIPVTFYIVVLAVKFLLSVLLTLCFAWRLGVGFPQYDLHK